MTRRQFLGKSIALTAAAEMNPKAGSLETPAKSGHTSGVHRYVMLSPF